MSPMATAQTMYAMGAAAPSAAATSAGSRKIPPPTVTLMTPAASAQVPIARTSDRSVEVRGSVIRLCAGGLAVRGHGSYRGGRKAIIALGLATRDSSVA